MADITTIKLEKKTKERIDKLRIHKRETYDEILQRMLGILNLSRANPDAAQGKLVGIERMKRKASTAQAWSAERRNSKIS